MTSIALEADRKIARDYKEKNKLCHHHVIPIVCTLSDHSSRPISAREIAQLLPEFILKTSYPSRRIIRQADNPSINPKTNFDEKFVYIFIKIYRYIAKIWNQSRSCGNFVKKPSTFRLDINLETDNPSKTNYPSAGTS